MLVSAEIDSGSVGVWGFVSGRWVPLGGAHRQYQGPFEAWSLGELVPYPIEVTHRLIVEPYPVPQRNQEAVFEASNRIARKLGVSRYRTYTSSPDLDLTDIPDAEYHHASFRVCVLNFVGDHFEPESVGYLVLRKQGERYTECWVLQRAEGGEDRFPLRGNCELQRLTGAADTFSSTPGHRLIGAMESELLAPYSSTISTFECEEHAVDEVSTVNALARVMLMEIDSGSVGVWLAAGNGAFEPLGGAHREKAAGPKEVWVIPQSRSFPIKENFQVRLRGCPPPQPDNNVEKAARCLAWESGLSKGKLFSLSNRLLQHDPGGTYQGYWQLFELTATDDGYQKAATHFATLGLYALSGKYIEKWAPTAALPERVNIPPRLSFEATWHDASDPEPSGYTHFVEVTVAPPVNISLDASNDCDKV